MNGVKKEVLRLSNTKTIFVAMLLVIFTSLLSFVLINSNPAQADDSSSDINLSINSALALSLTNCDSLGNLDTSINNQVINLDIIPTPNGLFKSTCQTLEVLTNTPGYSLTARASSTDLTYLNPRDTTLIPTTPTIPSTSSLPASPTTLTNNTWGFAVESRLGFDASYTINNANNNYSVLPASDLTIYQTDIFPLPQTTHKFFYATQLDTTTMAGTYGTTVTYTAIGVDVPLPEYVESYTTGQRYLYVTSDTPIVYGSKILVNGVECTNIAYVSLMSATCNTPPNTTGLKKITITPPPASQGNMQNYSGCSTLSIGDIVILTDTRNNQNYRIRKMEDNKCWMLDNLKIANITIINSDSNITSSTYNIPVIGTQGSADDTPYVDDPAINSPYKNNCLYNMGTNPDSLTGCGYLYSWSAATAGTGNGLSTNGQDATGSICPIGWRLPTGGTTGGDFGILNGAMSGETNTSNTDNSRSNWWSTGKFSGSYAGVFVGLSLSNQGLSGHWWSSTVNSSTATYYASPTYSNLYPGTNAIYKYYGYSVRCIGVN